jgi:hypothetical protein
MKIAEIKKGMKVYPIMKSIEGPLGKSPQWKLAVKSGKNFLTVVKLVEAKGQKPWFECSDKANATGGDKYHAGDLRLGIKVHRSKPTSARRPGLTSAQKKATPAKPAAKKITKTVAKAPIKDLRKSTKPADEKIVAKIDAAQASRDTAVAKVEAQ